MTSEFQFCGIEKAKVLVLLTSYNACPINAFVSAIKWLTRNHKTLSTDLIIFELITAAVDWIIHDKSKNEKILIVNGLSKNGQGGIGEKKMNYMKM